MEFNIVFTALVFMFVTNFLYAAVMGYDFLDQINVGQSSKYYLSQECASALDSIKAAYLSGLTTSGYVGAIYTELFISSTSASTTLTNYYNSEKTLTERCAEDIAKYPEIANFTTNEQITAFLQSYAVDPSRLTGSDENDDNFGKFIDVMNVIAYTLQMVIDAVTTFLSIVWQVMVYLWAGPLGTVMAMINSICILITIVWVFKAFSPGAD